MGAPSCTEPPRAHTSGASAPTAPLCPNAWTSPGAATPLVEPTLGIADFYAEYSPDGQRIAFESNRGDGWYEIWLAEADGSNPMCLTHGPGSDQGSPDWSPDGRTIAFDSKAGNGHFDLWTIGVDGAGLRQVTQDPADDETPRRSE